MPGSPFFTPELFDFLRHPKRHSSRDWFARNKRRYKEAFPALEPRRVFLRLVCVKNLGKLFGHAKNLLPFRVAWRSAGKQNLLHEPMGFFGGYVPLDDFCQDFNRAVAHEPVGLPPFPDFRGCPMRL
jgi:hypothetical protein